MKINVLKNVNENQYGFLEDKPLASTLLKQLYIDTTFH